MVTRSRAATSNRAGRRRLRASLTAIVLGASVAACGESAPTETVVALPIAASASHVGHVGTNGRSYAREMSQELTTTVTGDPDGVGTALLTLNAGLATVCWSLEAANVALPATAAHIHRAVAGLSGPIVLGLTPPGGDGTVTGCREGVDRGSIVDIFGDPSQYYVNVHTTEHPAGAIRAQLH